MDREDQKELGDAVKGFTRVDLGMVCMTRGIAALGLPVETLIAWVQRHEKGDWGVVSKNDADRNRFALENGERLLSAYPIDPQLSCEGFGENCVWIITEADRSVTTVILPEE